MDFTKVGVYTPVVGCDADISIPDAGLSEVAGPFGQGLAVRTLIHLDRQADGGNLQCPQVAAAVVEIVGHISESDDAAALDNPAGAAGNLRHGDTARTGGLSPVVDGRVVDAAYLIHQPALQSSGDKVGGEGLAAAGEVAGRCPKAGGHQGHVFAPVRVGVLLSVRTILAGGPAEQVVLRGVVGIFQCAGLAHAHGTQSQSQQNFAKFQGIISFHESF